MDEKIILILNEMSEYLSITQMKKLQELVYVGIRWYVKGWRENRGYV